MSGTSIETSLTSALAGSSFPTLGQTRAFEDVPTFALEAGQTQPQTLISSIASAETEEAENAQEAAAHGQTPREIWRIQLDPKSLQIYTEVLDNQGEVVFRLPPWVITAEDGPFMVSETLRQSPDSDFAVN